LTVSFPTWMRVPSKSISGLRRLKFLDMGTNVRCFIIISTFDTGNDHSLERRLYYNADV
jgi:hypothetical protein